MFWLGASNCAKPSRNLLRLRFDPVFCLLFRNSLISLNVTVIVDFEECDAVILGYVTVENQHVN